MGNEPKLLGSYLPTSQMSASAHTPEEATLTDGGVNLDAMSDEDIDRMIAEDTCTEFSVERFIHELETHRVMPEPSDMKTADLSRGVEALNELLNVKKCNVENMLNVEKMRFYEDIDYRNMMNRELRKRRVEKKNVDSDELVRKYWKRIRVDEHEHKYELSTVAMMIGKAYERIVAMSGYQVIVCGTLQSDLSRVSKWICGERTNPGLMISGGVGVGKSTLMKSAVWVLRQLGKVVHMATAAELNRMAVEDRAMFDEYCVCPVLAIDDLGAEPSVVKSYGNEQLPMVDLMTRRYDMMLPTIVTTNLPYNDGRKAMAERYGVRVADRMSEMFNYIQAGGDKQSWRTQNRIRLTKDEQQRILRPGSCNADAPASRADDKATV